MPNLALEGRSSMTTLEPMAVQFFIHETIQGQGDGWREDRSSIVVCGKNRQRQGFGNVVRRSSGFSVRSLKRWC
jgi:hypothetical protein